LLLRRSRVQNVQVAATDGRVALLVAGQRSDPHVDAVGLGLLYVAGEGGGGPFGHTEPSGPEVRVARALACHPVFQYEGLGELHRLDCLFAVERVAAAVGTSYPGAVLAEPGLEQPAPGVEVDAPNVDVAVTVGVLRNAAGELQDFLPGGGRAGFEPRLSEQVAVVVDQGRTDVVGKPPDLAVPGQVIDDAGIQVVDPYR